MKKYDAVIVLGFDVTEDGITPAEGKSRVECATRVIKSKEAVKIILSGDVSHLHNYKPLLTEAQSMKQYAVSLGIHEEQLITESSSQNTYENALFCKEIVDKHKWHSLLVVTSAFHLKRARTLFEKVFADKYSLEFRACENHLSKSEEKLIQEMENIKTGKLYSSQLPVINSDDAEMQRLLSQYLKQRTAS